MRTPDNETLDAAPERSCILTRERASPAALIRLALAPDGRVLPDVRAKAPGRGAWIGVDRAELEQAIAKGKLRGALARAFKTGEIAIPDDLPALIAAAQPIVHKAAVLDRVVAEVRRYPVLSSLVVGAIALLGPRRILDWGTRAITLYALLKG